MVNVHKLFLTFMESVRRLVCNSFDYSLRLELLNRELGTVYSIAVFISINSVLEEPEKGKPRTGAVSVPNLVSFC